MTLRPEGPTMTSGSTTTVSNSSEPLQPKPKVSKPSKPSVGRPKANTQSKKNIKSEKQCAATQDSHGNREVSIAIDFDFAKKHEFMEDSVDEVSSSDHNHSISARKTISEVDYPITAIEKYLRTNMPHIESSRKARLLLKDFLTLFLKNITLSAIKELSKTNRKILMPSDFSDALKDLGFTDLIPEKQLYEVISKKKNAAEFNQKMNDPETYKKMLEMQNKLFEHARSQENIQNSIDYARIQKDLEKNLDSDNIINKQEFSDTKVGDDDDYDQIEDIDFDKN